MIEARCLHCRDQRPIDEFVAEGGKVRGPLHMRLIHLDSRKVQRVQDGLCWRCDREKRAARMARGEGA